MAAGYTKAWKATCPRCSRRCTEKDFECGNCGSSGIYLQDLTTSSLAKSYWFGCRKCNQQVSGYLKCPQCETNVKGVAKKKGLFG